MTDNQSSDVSTFFNSDRPIERLEDDRLGRRSFAESVARHILATRSEHGFTAAITGEWGSGKTSVLNMIEETLERETEEVVILRFNPWLFRGTAELVTRFFDELSAQIGEGDSDRLKDVAKLLTGFWQINSTTYSNPRCGRSGSCSWQFDGQFYETHESSLKARPSKQSVRKRKNQDGRFH